MPAHIIKPKPDEDFYVRYSTIVDSPTEWGTRADLTAILRALDGSEAGEAARFDRADATGTSALWGEPPVFGWDEERLRVREGVEDPTKPENAWGTIARADIRAFCETADERGMFCPPAGMVTWEVFND